MKATVIEVGGREHKFKEVDWVVIYIGGKSFPISPSKFDNLIVENEYGLHIHWTPEGAVEIKSNKP